MGCPCHRGQAAAKKDRLFSRALKTTMTEREVPPGKLRRSVHSVAKRVSRQVRRGCRGPGAGYAGVAELL